MRHVLRVALYVLREAVARKLILAFLLGITWVLILMAIGLRLEVVDGALAATRLFGGPLGIEVISGQFGQARMESLLPGQWRASEHGDNGRVYVPAKSPTPSQGDTAAVGTWGDSMLVIGRTPEEVHGILERIEGRGSSEPPVLGGQYAYGDVYGVVSVERLADSLPPEQRALGERLKQLAPRARLNLDVSSDFALSVGLKGPDAERTADMAKAIGAAMALARFEAQSQGQTELARVLEYAGTSAMNDHLGVQLAVPLEVLRQELSWCRGASASGSTDAGSPAPAR